MSDLPAILIFYSLYSSIAFISLLRNPLICVICDTKKIPGRIWLPGISFASIVTASVFGHLDSHKTVRSVWTLDPQHQGIAAMFRLDDLVQIGQF